MRYFNPLALMAGLWFVASGLPMLRADDDVSRLDEIIDRVSQTLEASDLSEQQKQNVLGELRKSLAATMKPDDTTEETPSRPLDRSAQRAQQRSDQTERAPADARQRAEATRRQAEERQRQAEERSREMLRERGPQIGRQFAIGVMLERAADFGAKAELLISEVFPGSPAAEAGLKAGDVILKVDGDSVADPVEMTRRIRTAGRDDQSLSLEVSRDEQVLTFDIKPTLQPRDRGPLGFGRWDWELQFPPGMPGGRGFFNDPGWRFPTAPPGREFGDIQRISDVIRQIEMQQEQVNELRERVEAVEESIQQDQESTDH